jgi:hypothetical protein
MWLILVQRVEAIKAKRFWAKPLKKPYEYLGNVKLARSKAMTEK